MKKVWFIMAIVGLLFTACSNEDDMGLDSSIDGNATNGKKTIVNFEFDASVINYSPTESSLRYSPTYTKGGFKIYAFMQDSLTLDYKYATTVSADSMTYDPATKKLTGKTAINIGKYKFVASYGLDQTAVTVPTFTSSSVLDDTYSITYDGSAPLQEIFFSEGKTSASLKEYELGITPGANETVKDTLRRSVSRVDVLFLKVKKDTISPGVYQYTESPYKAGNDVFGRNSIEAIQMRYNNTLNGTMGLFGQFKPSTPFAANINLGNFGQTITIGNDTTVTETIIGNSTYTRYDSVVPTDLAHGGAHIFGNYLFPNADATPTNGLQIYIKPVGGNGRTITLNDLLPVEKNKVTLVKIYVVETDENKGGPGPGPDPEKPHVFSTNVTFEVEIITDWAGSHEVIGEIY
ncbi:MAG: hypothetical protein E6772_09520 [Dysgonomonas sp.]|nr:hypothetical protein [Dysgonomonas sp.]